MESGGGIDLNDTIIVEDDGIDIGQYRSGGEDEEIGEGNGEQVDGVSGEQSNLDESTNDNMNEPNLGMSFCNGEDFAKFFHDYAKCKGFSFFCRTSTLMKVFKDRGEVRTAAGKNEPMYHMMTRIRFQCKQGGRKQSDGSNVTGCPLFIDGCIKDDRMLINKLMLDHNHNLFPTCNRFMVNYRIIDDSKAARITTNDEASIPITRNYNAEVVGNRGPENITFNQKNVRNLVNLERRKSRFYGDAVAFEKHFEQQYEYDNGYYYAIEKDDEGKLLNAFCSDPRGRAMCQDFGGVVTFDTTFLSNRYRMPFAPFVRVNHHRKSIVFAATLISHEDAEKFGWVFKPWLNCMGRPPQAILTDQCRAIGKAVETVFPGVPHRLSLWHILNNASKNLGKLAKWTDIEKSLRLVVHNSLDPTEFDEAWGAMIEKFGLQDNSWLKDTFDMRKRRAPGY